MPTLDIKQTLDNDIVRLTQQEFTKPIYQNIFFQNLHILKEKSQSVDFLTKYDYNPQKVSYEYYNTSGLYQIILLVNNCPSIFEFTIKRYKTILVPDYDVITELVYIVI